jgi:hypothetical protein
MHQACTEFRISHIYMYVYLFVLLKYTENEIPYTDFIKVIIPSILSIYLEYTEPYFLHIQRIYGIVFSTYTEDIRNRIFYIYRGYTKSYFLHIQMIYGIVFSTYTEDIRNRIFYIYRGYTELYF